MIDNLKSFFNMNPNSKLQKLRLIISVKGRKQGRRIVI